MAALTCLACRVVFADPNVQRLHYKTDWHRYNLKRKIVELPPITDDEFQQKIEFQTKKKVETFSGNSTFCKICNKPFSSDNAYANHVKSKKHRSLAATSITKLKDDESNEKTPSVVKSTKKANIRPKVGYIPPVDDTLEADDDSDDWEDVDEEEITSSGEEEYNDEDPSEAIPPTFCLFCPHESVSVPDNLRHMCKSHSFYIPDVEYVTDLQAFLIYLGAKVGDGKVCLHCNNHSKQFQSTRACQAHMLDKRHFTLDYDEHSILEYADFYDFSSSYPDHASEESVDSELPIDDQLISVDADTLELVLPSGARAGHRALRQYYKQSLTTNESNSNRSRAMITNVNNQYRSLGVTGASLSLVVRKSLEGRKKQNSHYAKQSLGLGVRNNKLQKYFRKQMMYCG